MSAGSWRGNPQIMAARDYAKRFGCRAVIVISIEDLGPNAGRWHYQSYGKDGRTCDAAGRVMGRIADAIENGEIDVSELEAPHA